MTKKQQPALELERSPYMSDLHTMRAITPAEEQRLKNATEYMWRLMFKTGIYRLDIGPWFIRSSLGEDDLINPAMLEAFLTLLEGAEHALQTCQQDDTP